ncbi:hypothetical protein, partial [Mesorhizobium sp. M7A.F.Ca.CA.003.01.2.1]
FTNGGAHAASRFVSSPAFARIDCVGATCHPVPVTSLAGRFPHEAWASFAQEGSYFQGKPNR